MGKYLIIVLVFIALALGEEEEAPINKRKPKLLLVTTTTSSTTLSTGTACYVATAVLGPLNCKRRKRNLREEDPAETSKFIEPSRAVAGSEMEIEDSKLEARDPKFLNYFLTVTKTFTFTSHTATSTLGSVYCTPDGWTMGACAGYAGRRR